MEAGQEWYEECTLCRPLKSEAFRVLSKQGFYQGTVKPSFCMAGERHLKQNIAQRKGARIQGCGMHVSAVCGRQVPLRGAAAMWQL